MCPHQNGISFTNQAAVAYVCLYTGTLPAPSPTVPFGLSERWPIWRIAGAFPVKGVGLFDVTGKGCGCLPTNSTDQRRSLTASLCLPALA